MKISILIFTVITFHGAVIAQDVNEQIAKETCDCISNLDLSKFSKKEIEIQLGLCMLESAKKNGLNPHIDNPTEMTELGQNIGLKMAGICPKVFTYFMEDKEKTQTQSVIGKIKSITEGDFYYLMVTEDNGREHKFIWLRYFKGAEELLQGLKKTEGKKVKVTYTIMECYSPKVKMYLPEKEITELTIEK